MFKKTFIAMALASTALAANAYQIGENNDFNVEVYGVVAMSAVNYNVDNKEGTAGGDEGTVLENESRVGFRANKEMIQGLNVIMQVESGYVDMVDNAHGGTAGGVLGFRDTFVGLESNSWGKIRFGRVLTPLYEIIDWPFSNPGLGSVFDWGGLVANYDRQSNQIRYDSPAWGGFKFSASLGRDATDPNAYGTGGKTATDGSYFTSESATYAISMVTLMGAIESGKDFKGEVGQDNLTYLFAANVELPGGFSLKAAYKQAELKGYDAPTPVAPVASGYGRDGEKVTQGSYSVIGQYVINPFAFRVGYAENLKSKSNGKIFYNTNTEANTDSNTISGQAMVDLNGFVPYVRVAGRTDHMQSQRTDVVTRLGLEYGF